MAFTDGIGCLEEPVKRLSISMAFENTWHLRHVADTACKACWVCYKPTASVLITPNNKDYFYICAGHLKDRGFCQPDADEAVGIDANHKEEMNRETETVKNECEDKPKAKRENQASMGKEKDSVRKKKEDVEGTKDQSVTENKTQAKAKGSTDKAKKDSKIYHLHPTFYQNRLSKVYRENLARINRERVQDSNFFPSVPSNLF